MISLTSTASLEEVPYSETDETKERYSTEYCEWDNEVFVPMRGELVESSG